MRIETQILSNLINNEDYLRKVVPFIKSDYFTETDDRIVFGKISEYVQKYNDPPAKSALLIGYKPSGSSVIGVYYADLKKQLRVSIKETRREKLSKGVLLLHDNAPVHKSQITQVANA